MPAIASWAALLLLTAGTLERGDMFTYRGTLQADRAEPGTPEKQFQLTVVVTEATAETVTFAWILDEQGRGTWTWLDRFGTTHYGAGADEMPGPALLDQLDQRTSVVPLTLPFLLPPQPLSAGAEWEEGQLRYVTRDATAQDGQAVWRVDVHNAYGRRRTCYVEQQRPVLVALEEPVVLGQGEQHTVRYSRTADRRLDEAEMSRFAATHEALQTLRSALAFPPHTRDPQWDTQQISQLEAALPALAKTAAGTPLQGAVAAAQQEARRQQERTGALNVVARRLMGQPAPQPALTTLDGKPFDWSAQAGAVTVLHFWSYQDVPLEEPYGQVAYVDFLYRQFDPRQVRVLGIAADSKLSDVATRKASIQSVKRLKSFMNLSYPLLADDGNALKAFGDPQRTGAALPLYVVLDQQGRVTHYHVGHHAIDARKGLIALTEAVNRALENAP